MTLAATEHVRGVWSCEQDDAGRDIRQVVIAGSRDVLVVDAGLPGAPRGGVLPLLESLAPRQVTLLLTHPDADHRGGAREILDARPDARVVAGNADAALAANPELLLRERVGRFAAADDLPLDSATAERILRRAGPLVPVEPVASRAALSLGGRTVTLVATAGHSPGHMAAWLPAERVLAAGDAVMGDAIHDRAGAPRIPPMYAPPATYRATVERIRSLRPALLLTGHEPPLTGDALTRFLDKSVSACDRIGAVLVAELGDAPRTLGDLCRAVAAAITGLPAEHAMDLALTLDGHLAELADAGRVAVDAGPPRRFWRSA